MDLTVLGRAPQKFSANGSSKLWRKVNKNRLRKTIGRSSGVNFQNHARFSKNSQNVEVPTSYAATRPFPTITPKKSSQSSLDLKEDRLPPYSEGNCVFRYEVRVCDSKCPWPGSKSLSPRWFLHGLTCQSGPVEANGREGCGLLAGSLGR